jgi:hypothetical protein
MAIDHLKDLGWPISLPPGIHFNSASVVADGVFRPFFRPKELGDSIAEIIRMGLEHFPLSIRIFAFDHLASDSVILDTAGVNLSKAVHPLRDTGASSLDRIHDDWR